MKLERSTTHTFGQLLAAADRRFVRILNVGAWRGEGGLPRPLRPISAVRPSSCGSSLKLTLRADRSKERKIPLPPHMKLLAERLA